MKKMAPTIHERLRRLLRWRLWIIEKLRPSPWQETLCWAAVAGVCGALTALGFRYGLDVIHSELTGTNEGMVDSFIDLPKVLRVVIPTIGGLIAGLVLLAGRRLHPGESSTDYM